MLLQIIKVMIKFVNYQKKIKLRILEEKWTMFYQDITTTLEYNLGTIVRCNADCPLEKNAKQNAEHL